MRGATTSQLLRGAARDHDACWTVLASRSPVWARLVCLGFCLDLWEDVSFVVDVPSKMVQPISSIWLCLHTNWRHPRQGSGAPASIPRMPLYLIV
ncbi:hypothetical protein VTK26DRAFT_7101 [Humicola hyalothermophila]